ncbi:calpain-13-like [Eublepharis macularius]|uniref:Calpain-13-like n=1 Tax=Eublepharis macularius TaxID=481883 RepID=A0AA97JY00_EUBMA|nr:calpain-13-like [Eublepharis macularius]XP_054845255.1 calpain-13-like [Eublepharis macularius]XP_054845339.1 calpain-13-like [Eublepharis macularius]
MDVIPDKYQKKQEQDWQTIGRAGNPTSPQKFLKQDFVYLRDYCLSQGVLFEDDTFPAHVSSIGYNLLSEDKLHQIQWMRPNDILENPKLIVNDVSRFDILQGEIGDCWLLAALGSLTLQQRFLENVIPKDQDFKHNYAGIFHFRFWHFGDWMDVVIDDRLPFLNGRYLSVHPRSTSEFWPSLLEKAYAKLHGSYQNLHWGFISEALVGFTGGIQMSFDLQRSFSYLHKIVKAAAKSGCLMGCTTPGARSTGNIELKNGIVLGHAYTVTWTAEVPYKDRKECLIRIWNPWGHGEWRGPWSDGSVEWDQVPVEYKNHYYQNKNDGEFWISYQDFIDNFSSLCICNNVPTFLNYGEHSNATWSLDMHVGQWPRGGGSSGGSSRKAQYSIHVPEPDLKTYNVVVSLMQKPLNNRHNSQLLRIGFRIFGGGTKPQELSTGFEQAQDIVNYFYLSPGTYTIIPASQEDQECEFLLRIFQRNQSDNRELNTKVNPVVPKDMPRWNQDNSYEKVFRRYANQSSYLDASQLQRILNDVFLKDLMASLGSEDRFSFDSCRSLLALMDFNANGRLVLQEFQLLWRYLNKYKEIFRREDENKSGFLEVSNLTRVIQMAGLSVDDKLLQLMTVRYGDSSMRLSFPDFACCMIRLETMAKAFRNLSVGGRGISFSEDQWMTIIMYC